MATDRLCGRSLIKDYILYSLVYLVGITLIVIMMLSIGQVLSPGRNILWFAGGVAFLTILFFYFVNRKITQLRVPLWYKSLNLLFWCLLVLVLGLYFK